VIAKLTNRVVLSAKPKGSPFEIRDSELKGLLLRVQPSGSRSYVVELGRGRRKTVGNAAIVTLEQARITARSWLAERDQGKLPMPARGKNKPLTLGEFVAEKYGPWVCSERKAGRATLANISAQFGSLFRVPLAELTGWQLEQFKQARVRSGVSIATVNRDLDRIRAVLSKAVEWGHLEASPARTVKRLKGGQGNRVRYLLPDEERRLRDALAARDSLRSSRRMSGNEWRQSRGKEPRREFDSFSDHLSPMVLLALNTGLRRGEIFRLRWSDVDRKASTLHVRAETTKSQRERRVPLNSEARSVLERWLPVSGGKDLIFPSPGGGVLTNINRSWERLIASAEIVDFRFHDCRHHFASQLVMQGADLYTVRELLGHRDFETTQRYAHLAESHKAAAVERLVNGSRSAPSKSRRGSANG
jgi:integrase